LGRNKAWLGSPSRLIRPPVTDHAPQAVPVSRRVWPGPHLFVLRLGALNISRRVGIGAQRTADMIRVVLVAACASNAGVTARTTLSEPA
jgi:hypothetical protein